MSIYGTLADSKTYHAARGNTAWAAADDDDLNVALLRGAEFIDFHYRTSFPGFKTGRRAQTREWPRTDALDADREDIPFDTVPIEVENAAYEAALRELATPGILLPDVVQGTQIKRASVDGAVAVEYTGPTGIAAVQPILTIVAGILGRVLTGRGGSNPLVGQTFRVQ